MNLAPRCMLPPFCEETLAQAVVMMANIERAGDAQLTVKIVSKLLEFITI